MASVDFALNPALDPAFIARTFAACGRIEIRDFLAPGQANRLRAHLLDRADWVVVLNAGDKVYEIPRAGLSSMTLEQREGLDRRVTEAARHGFQYRYQAVRVPDAPGERSRHDTLLGAFVAFMGSQPVLALMSEIVGEVAFADGQATAYTTGDFLTRHDDNVAGKHRRAAYVFGLSPGWRAEWGGLLMFHGDDGNIDGAFAPAMGALRLFAVPVAHSVSYVTPSAPEPRLAVTGWLRTKAPQSSA